MCLVSFKYKFLREHHGVLHNLNAATNRCLPQHLLASHYTASCINMHNIVTKVILNELWLDVQDDDAWLKYLSS